VQDWQTDKPGKDWLICKKCEESGEAAGVLVADVMGIVGFEPT
jgi:hypothetical protein